MPERLFHASTSASWDVRQRLVDTRRSALHSRLSSRATLTPVTRVSVSGSPAPSPLLPFMAASILGVSLSCYPGSGSLSSREKSLADYLLLTCELPNVRRCRTDRMLALPTTIESGDCFHSAPRKKEDDPILASVKFGPT